MEQSRIIDLLRDCNLSGENFGEKQSFLMQWYESTKSTYEEESRSRDTLVEELRDMQSTLALKVTHVIEELDPKLDGLLATIRVDIGIDKDGGRRFKKASKIDHKELRKKFLEQDKRVRDIAEQDKQSP
jgi:hypothetical protein